MSMTAHYADLRKNGTYQWVNIHLLWLVESYLTIADRTHLAFPVERCHANCLGGPVGILIFGLQLIGYILKLLYTRTDAHY